MADSGGLEKSLDEIFVKKAPALPDSVKKWIVEYIPYINLFFGVIMLFLAFNLYHWATRVNQVVDYVNQFARAYGVQEQATSKLTVWVWVSLILLVIEALLYVFSYSGLKSKNKSGWNLVFYALIINAVYGIFTLFIDNYGGITNAFGYVLGTAIGFYFLFQIRSYYLPKAAKTVHKDKKKSE